MTALLDGLRDEHPVLLALYATLFTWGVTALGAAVVFATRGVLGAAAVLAMRPLLPYALAFAAGAMIYVVIEELIPAAQRSGNTDLATVSTLGGFLLMMVLDVALG